MHLLKTASKRFRKNLNNYQTKRKLQELHSINVPAADKIANAISSALINNLTFEEKASIEPIEKLRKELNSSSKELSVTDYGAGNSNLNRSEKEMHDGVVTTRLVSDCCRASKPYFWSLILFKLVKEFKPSTCIELGTCLGISAAYQASALKLNKKGRIITMEGSASLASLSEDTLKRFNLDNAIVVSGRFQDNLSDVLTSNKPIDYAFIDGHHEENATISYFVSFIPYLSKQSIIIFDDISWSDGMCRAWSKIVENEAVKISVNLGAIGICVLDKDIERKYCFEVLLQQ